VPFVLDASAMVALAREEPGIERVLDALTEPGEHCFAHYVNLCEVYYTTLRRHAEADAAAVIRVLIDEAGVVPYESPDAAFYWEVGRLRAQVTTARLSASLADCFCIATARALDCELLTCDHREFDRIIPPGLCTVNFIR
jgi:PIN domain nuclease of toxin-antitoxin system